MSLKSLKLPFLGLETIYSVTVTFRTEFSDDKEKLTWMVNDIEELLDLDMEPKPESLWWTSTHRDEPCVNTEGEEQRENVGLALHGGIRCAGLPFFERWKRVQRNGEDAQERFGELVAGWVHLSRKKCVSEEEV